MDGLTRMVGIMGQEKERTVPMVVLVGKVERGNGEDYRRRGPRLQCQQS